MHPPDSMPEWTSLTVNCRTLPKVPRTLENGLTGIKTASVSVSSFSIH